MLRSGLRACALAVAALALAGCTSYYRVTDPTTGQTYYTTEVQHLNSGATRLKDERTKKQVTIQNSHVEQITQDQYEVGVRSQPTTRGL
jgi:hypothetical protein